MKKFKTLDKHMQDGEIALELFTPGEGYDCGKEVYLILALAQSHPNFLGSVGMTKESATELRDALNEVIEAYP